MKLSLPEFGAGKWKKNGEKFWNVEAYTDAGWSATRPTVVAQVALFISSMETSHMPPAERNVLFL